MLSMGVIHGVALLLTIVLVIGAGVWCSRGQQGAAGFSLGGRKSGAGLVAGAIISSAVGGGATVGTAQMAFLHGMVAWCFMLGVGLGLLVLGLFFAGPLRRSGLETVPQYLRHHYGRAAEPIVSIISCSGIFFACAGSVLPGVELIHDMFRIPVIPSALLLVLLMTLYVSLGGQRGSGVSGMLKSAVLWSALLLCSLYAAKTLAQEDAPALPEGTFSLVSLGWGYTASCLGATAMGIITAQMYIQALFSATDARTARRGALWGALLAVPVGFMSSVVGIYMRVHYPQMNPVLALPAFLLHEVPAWLGGVALGGIVLSIVSSAAVQALAIGTMVSRDLAGELLGIRKEGVLVAINRAVLVLTGLGVAGYCLLHRDASILTWNYLSMALRGCGIFLPLALAVLLGHRVTSRLSARWVSASMVLSALVSLGSSLLWDIPPTGIGLALSGTIIGCTMYAGRRAK